MYSHNVCYQAKEVEVKNCKPLQAGGWRLNWWIGELRSSRNETSTALYDANSDVCNEPPSCFVNKNPHFLDHKVVPNFLRSFGVMHVDISVLINSQISFTEY